MNTVGGPTQNYGAKSEHAWVARPWSARLFRLLIWLVPVVASFLVIFFAARSFPPDELGINVWLWWLLFGGLALLVLIASDRGMRRFLPVVTLLRMSLVFPDKAPPRFATALRAQPTRRLGENEFPDSAELVALVRSIGQHDRMTRGHSERVRAHSDLIGEEVAISEEDRNRLSWAALLHDVGKLSVSPAILNKAGRPDDDEWQSLRGHPAAAPHHLGAVGTWLGGWERAASEHHERWDGDGYPNGLAGEEIHISARIVAVADAYEVMTSPRSYKKPMSTALAREEIARNSGKQFDPAVVRAFLNVGIGSVGSGWGVFTWLAGQSDAISRLAGAASVAAVAVIATTSGFFGDFTAGSNNVEFVAASAEGLTEQADPVADATPEADADTTTASADSSGGAGGADAGDGGGGGDGGDGGDDGDGGGDGGDGGDDGDGGGDGGDGGDGGSSDSAEPGSADSLRPGAGGEVGGDNASGSDGTDGAPRIGGPFSRPFSDYVPNADGTPPKFGSPTPTVVPPPSDDPQSSTPPPASNPAAVANPEPTPTPTVEPTPTVPPTPTPEPPEATLPPPVPSTPQPTPTPSPTPSPTTTATPAPTATPNPAATPTANPTPAPTATASPTPTPAATATPTATPTPAATATPTATPTPAATATPTATPTPAATATPTATPTPAATATPTATPTPAATATPTATPTPAGPCCEITVAVNWSGGTASNLPNSWIFTLSNSCGSGSIDNIRVNKDQFVGSTVTLATATDAVGCTITITWRAAPGWTDLAGDTRVLVGGTDTTASFNFSPL